MSRKQHPIPRPILKWAGGKAKSTELILSRMPRKIRTYYEPFFGGGAVFFALVRAGRIKSAVISDTNTELITTLQAVRDALGRVLSELERLAFLPVTEERYAHIRNWSPSKHHEIAARMIFLNKTGFNGLYRVNQSGVFNAPWGKHEKFVPDVANIAAVSQALESVTIQSRRFDVAVEDAEKGDVVYFDPPYFPTSKTASFTAYTRRGFTHSDQLRLAATFAELARNRVTVLASNADVPAARGVYEAIHGVEIIQASVPRAINCKGGCRGRVGELLIVANGSKRAAQAAE